MNILSILIGVGAFVVAMVGLIPLLGWLNWIALPLAALGGIIGALGKNKAGLTINAIVIAVAAIRLLIGGGLL